MKVSCAVYSTVRSVSWLAAMVLVDVLSAERAVPEQHLHTPESLEHCSGFLSREEQLHAAPLVILAYLTDFPQHSWMLGVSAADRELPLLLVGQGRRWTGPIGKLWGIARAAQVLSHVVPTKPIVVLDGIDTFVANGLSDMAHATLRAIGRSASSVLVSTECNLWPQCSRKYQFRTEVQAHRTCRKEGWPSCYPNGGAYTASARGLMRFASLQLAMHETSKANTPNATASWVGSNDQYILQSIYLQQDAGSHNLTIDVDGPGEVFLSLMPCSFHRGRRGLNCFDKAWAPMEHVQANETTREVAFTLNSSRQLPLILHSNADPQYARWHTSALRPAWRHLFPPGKRLLEHRVLLLDSAIGGACAAANLGELLRHGHNGSTRPWDAKRTFGGG